MVAPRQIESIQARLHELRGSIWRDRELSRSRADRLNREARMLMREVNTPDDVAVLQSILALTQIVRNGLDHPA